MLYDILDTFRRAVKEASDRATQLNYINQAYREFYNHTDMPGVLREQYFETHEENQLISMPWYVGEIRACRRQKTFSSIMINDMSPRYHHRPWRQIRNNWRIIGRRPLHTPLSIESQLTFTLSQAQGEPFTITTKGQVPNAASITETLTVPAGTLAVTTTAQFAKDDPFGVETISKSNTTTCDIVVTDGLGVEVALIPNCLSNASNIIVQTNDLLPVGVSQNTDNIVETLYKPQFIPLYYDTDEVMFPKIEDAIVWKARAYFYGLSKDQLAGQQAILADQKATQLYADAIANRDMEVEKSINVAPNPYEKPWRYNPFGISDSGSTYR